MKIKQEGDYRIAEAKLPESWWTNEVTRPDHSVATVNGTCPVRGGADGTPEYYIRPIPYGKDCHDIDGVIQDCDLLTYFDRSEKGITDGPSPIKLDSGFAGIHFDTLLRLLKQRGFHAETAYLDEDGKARQISPWSEHDYPQDRLFHEDKTAEHIIQIYRLSLAPMGISVERERRLKHELIRCQYRRKRSFLQGETLSPPTCQMRKKASTQEHCLG